MKHCDISLRKYILLVCTGLISFLGWSQTPAFSPYSRFGLGQPSRQVLAHQAGFGGATMTIMDPFRVNISNPAGYAFLGDPVLSITITSERSQFISTSDNVEFVYGRLNDAVFAVPLAKNKAGFVMGIKPFTDMGYDVVVLDRLPDAEGTQFQSNYAGTGGLYQPFIGGSYRVYNHIDTVGNVTTLAAGLHINYTLGALNYERKVFFPPSFNGVNFKEVESIFIKDVLFDLGVHFQTNLKKRTATDPSYLKLLAGATLKPSANLNGTRSLTALTFQVSNATGVDIPIDTISSFKEQPGAVFLPGGMAAGLGFDYFSSQRTRLRLAVDYRTEMWEDFETAFTGQVQEIQLQNSSEVAMGLEFTPTLGSNKILRRMEYRVGYRTGQTFMRFRGENIYQSGMAFGLTAPINARRNLTRSSFSFAAEYGNMGTTEQGLIEQKHWRLYFGLSLAPHFRNVWLKKKKYD